MEHIKTLACEIKKEVSKFLTKQGGFANGYITYVNGSITLSTVSDCLEWSTPISEELTGKQISNLGCTLYDKLHQLLKESGLDVTVVLKAKHLEYGCYKQQLKIIFEY